MWKNENTDSGIVRGSFICCTWQLNSRAKENLFPLELVLSCAGEECVKMLFPGAQPTYAMVLLSRRAKVNSGMWFLRLRFRLRAE